MADPTPKDLIKPNSTIEPGKAIKLLKAYGFEPVSHHGYEAWEHPVTKHLLDFDLSRAQRERKPIYGKVAQDIGHVCLESEKALNTPDIEAQRAAVPDWLKKEAGSSFDVLNDNNTITVSAVEHPEYKFKLRISGKEEIDIKSQRSVLEHHIKAYESYKENLRNLEAEGYRVDRDTIPPQLNFPPLNLPSTSLQGDAAALEGQIRQARDMVKQEYDNRWFLQEELLEQLKGFTIEQQPATNIHDIGSIIITHPERPDFRKKFDTYGGKANIIFDEQQNELLKLAASATLEKPTDRSHNLKEDTENKESQALHSQAQPVRVSAEQLLPPNSGQHTLLMDTGALLQLCKPRASETGDAQWSDLFHPDIRLPNIGKIIIPDFIADFEMQGVVTTYDKQDNPITSPAISANFENGGKHQPSIDRFKKEIRNAARLHIDPDGNKVLLYDPSVPESERSQDVIIWETELGRKHAEDIAALLSKGRAQEVKAIYWKDRNDHAAKKNGGDKGEDVIDAFLRDEMPYKTPAAVLTSDEHYIEKADKLLPTHRQGLPISRSTIAAYMDAEFEFRGKELCSLLKLPSENPREVMAGILTGMGYTQNADRHFKSRTGDYARDFPGKNAGLPGAGIHAIVGTGVQQLKILRGETEEHAVYKSDISPKVTLTPEKAVLSGAPEPVPVTIATPETRELGDAYRELMDERKLSNGELADRTNQKMHGSIPQVTEEHIRHFRSGRQVPIDDIYFAHEDILINENPKIGDKENARRMFRDLYKAAHEAQAAKERQAFISDEAYHSFGELIEKKMPEVGIKSDEEFAERIRLNIDARLKPAETNINSKMVVEILNGDRTASPGLALAMVKSLDTADKSKPLSVDTKIKLYDLNKASRAGMEPIPVATSVETLRRKVRTYFEPYSELKFRDDISPGKLANAIIPYKTGDSVFGAGDISKLIGSGSSRLVLSDEKRDEYRESMASYLTYQLERSGSQPRQVEAIVRSFERDFNNLVEKLHERDGRQR